MRIFWTAIILLFVVLTRAPIINSDSVNGFEALKGWKISGEFNTIIQPKTTDISQFDGKFLSWWTPGQYIAPYVISLTGLSLGHSIVLLNFICMLVGLVGFYKLFTLSGFDLPVIVMSLVLIASSNTVLYRFISYQGGESLSFIMFPWAVYWFMKSNKILTRAILAFTFTLTGFLAKSQMLIALTPVFFLIPFGEMIKNRIAGRQLDIISLVKQSGLYLISTGAALLLLYFSFLCKGASPAGIDSLNPSVEDFLIPLASPISSISNVSDILLKNMNDPDLTIILPTICTLFTLVVFFHRIRRPYTIFVFLYYLCFSLVFIFLYVFDSPIDYQVRHFKFVGYMFFPALVSLAKDFLKYRITVFVIAAIVLFSLFNHYRLAKVWFDGTYVTKGDFRVTEKEFPKELYNYLANVREPVLFFSPFEPRWAIDKDIICVNNTERKIYKGHGLPVVFIGEGLFPDYSIQSVDSVAGYKVSWMR